RMLTSGEYTSNSLVGGATTNVDLTAGTALAASGTINSLRMQGGGGMTINGGQTLTLNTGCLITTNGANAGIQTDGTANSTLALGANNAVFFTDQALTIGSTSANGAVTVTGTGGLLKGGAGTLTLNNTNTLSGSVYIGQGSLVYGVANALPSTSASQVSIAPG